MSTEIPVDQQASPDSPSRVEQSLTTPKASFPELPPDIRLSIWEAEEYENEDRLYSRDMGLWNACRESRRVIAAHYQRLDSIEMQRAAQTTREKNARPVTSVKNDFFTVAFGPFIEESNMKPTYHRLCIRTSSPESLMPRLKRLNLYLPMVKNLSKISLSRDWNLVFDKDHSFDDPQPSDWTNLMAETSQRSMWYRCQSAIWCGKADPDCPLVLIDKTRPYLVRDRIFSIISLDDECYLKIQVYEPPPVGRRHHYWDMMALWRQSSSDHRLSRNAAYSNSPDVYVPCSCRLIPLQGN
ncbi:uncharacterized protein FIESC28_05829 [Fusarium coffeatum]|uniref:Uncharacterized protein n=1 Tax=Fusarium coffeatum TaxID=231269 RepID=A0A366RP69_9HYPO|nr:uncharacterized protein FIESC28_05829 [Fusarium coffeatum]RBR18907.1 hypothetical protein FIESC28_05829 [Fusarium coffeatum]